MLSTDKTLLGQRGIGDAVARHRQYAARVNRLDIGVVGASSQPVVSLAANAEVFAVPIISGRSLLARRWRRQSYDLIVCQDPFITGWLGCFLKRRFGARLIIHFHGDFLDNPYWLHEHWRNYVYRWLANRTIYQADRLRVVSSGIREKLLRRGIEPKRIVTIPTPVNLAQFNTAPSREDGDLIVLTVGRIVKAKDFPTLIRAARELFKRQPTAEWRIIGMGPLYARYRQSTADEPRLKWLGHTNHADLAVQYRQARVVVMTSTNESFGKIFLEAAMAHLPAVATDTVGAQEIIIDNQTGFIVPIGDWQAVAERVERLLTQPDVCRQFGDAAYHHVVKTFDWNRGIESIIAFWHDTVGDTTI